METTTQFDLAADYYAAKVVESMAARHHASAAHFLECVQKIHEAECLVANALKQIEYAAKQASAV